MCYKVNLVTEFSQDSLCFVQYPFVIIGKLFDILINICNFNHTLILKKLSLNYLTTMRKGSSFKQLSVSLIFGGDPEPGRFLKSVSSCPFFAVEEV